MPEKEREKILEVDGLCTKFHTERGDLKAIDGVSFCVYKGEIIGIVQNPLMGATEEEVVAPTDGILMTLREHPSVTEGSLVARVIGGNAL